MLTQDLGDKLTQITNNMSANEQYNSETLIIHSDQDNGTMRIQKSSSRDDLSNSKGNHGDHSQYQQYVEFMKDADQVMENRELLTDKTKLIKEIGMCVWSCGCLCFFIFVCFSV